MKGFAILELPSFVAEIQRLSTAGQICDYLDDLEKRKSLAPREPDPVLDDLDEPDDENYGWRIR